MLREDIPVTVVSEDADAIGQSRRESHPAFGVAVVTRANGTPRTLFQSDLRHTETITLRIHAAERDRSLNRDWVHPGDKIVEVELSPAQWGALVSSIGIGSGVPVTIRSTAPGGAVPGIPYEPRIAESVKEAEGAVCKLLEPARRTLAGLEEAIDQKQGVRAVREALRLHTAALANARGNAGFAVTSLTQAAEGVVAQAEADIEAHILAAAQAAGLTVPVAMPGLGAGTGGES